MAKRIAHARDIAQWRGPDEVWIDHADLAISDLEWLAPVRTLTLWAVRDPESVLPLLPQLDWLDVRGGSTPSAHFVSGCGHLRYLQINQVRGLSDLSALADLTSLVCLSLYGLPQVREIPSLRGLTDLRWAAVGSMKGLTGLTGLLDAPLLNELWLVRKVALAPSDPDALANHQALRAFGWFSEDVPDRTSQPVVERVNKPQPENLSAADWFAMREESAE